ncbi:cytochrome P450 [Saccharomonospora glauca]|jgi:cytochrome P450|uniref:Cytochrome P450 n=1 Tax=Saccharomonospora glauca K62 TaxID=928724 RepID=I1D2F3_9PSEU|nr:cytochrome P450 [Saccharomonospora glauca]EIE99127.1 cytochrome P450 [Saccharomonospora glauca K62]
MRLDDVNLCDLDRFLDPQAPWRMFDVLRKHSPVHWHPEPEPNSGFWAVTRWSDIVAVNRDPATFTSEYFTNLEEIHDPQIRDLRRSMMETDGHRHRSLRLLVQRDFTPRTVAQYAVFLRGLTATTLDNALRSESFDFVAEVAAELPIMVLARLMLDVPAEDTGKLIAWGNRIIGNHDPDCADVLMDSPDSERYKHIPFRSPAALEIFRYGRELAAQRRGGTGTDLVSKLVNTVPRDGVPLTPTDFDNYFLLLVVAGNETTRHAISSAVLALSENPEQWWRLKENPDLIETAVEEFLRWASPVYHFRRTATRDTELAGQPIRAGDKVVMWFASGNRDETVFDRPYEFDVGRTPNDHLTFGLGGPHFCLGSALARMELRILFEELLARVEQIRVTGPVTRLRSNFVNGIKTLPVTVTK